MRESAPMKGYMAADVMVEAANDDIALEPLASTLSWSLLANLSSRADDLCAEEALSEASDAFQQFSPLDRIAIYDAAQEANYARHYSRSHFLFAVDLREVFVVEEDRREASNRFRPMGPFVHCWRRPRRQDAPLLNARLRHGILILVWSLDCRGAAGQQSALVAPFRSRSGAVALRPSRSVPSPVFRRGCCRIQIRLPRERGREPPAPNEGATQSGRCCCVGVGLELCVAVELQRGLRCGAVTRSHYWAARARTLSGRGDRRAGVDRGIGGGGNPSWRRETAPIAESSVAA